MPKRMFWPIAMVVVGLILIATKMDLLPAQLWNLWPIVLIVAGLGGLLVSDKEEWDGQPSAKVAKKPSARVQKVPKKASKSAARRKK